MHAIAPREDLQGVGRPSFNFPVSLYLYFLLSLPPSLTLYLSLRAHASLFSPRRRIRTRCAGIRSAVSGYLGPFFPFVLRGSPTVVCLCVPSSGSEIMPGAPPSLAWLQAPTAAAAAAVFSLGFCCCCCCSRAGLRRSVLGGRIITSEPRWLRKTAEGVARHYKNQQQTPPLLPFFGFLCFGRRLRQRRSNE